MVRQEIIQTLWLSHLSMVTPGNPPRYLNWKSSEPMVAGSIGFEFSDASTIKKLLRRKNGKIEEKDILKKIEAPKDRKLIDTYVQGHASFKLINLYKIKTNENAFVLLYKNTSNNSLVEINYLNNLDSVKDIKVYTDGANNNFGEPGTEKIFLKGRKPSFKKLNSLKAPRTINVGSFFTPPTE